MSTQMMEVPVVTDRRRGAIGVDLNADHVAVAETDASGNYVNAWRVPLVTYGKNTTRRRLSSATRWPAWCSTRKKSASPSSSRSWTSGRRRPLWRASPAILPDAVELQLRQDQGVLRLPWLPSGSGSTIRSTRPTVPSSAGEVHGTIRAHGAPGSGLGAGPSLLNCSERIPRRWVCPVGNGVHVAFTVPARKRVKHVWTYWGVISGQLRPALAAQHRLGRPNPVRAVRRVKARGMA